MTERAWRWLGAAFAVAAILWIVGVACLGNRGSAPPENWTTTGEGWPVRVIGKETCLDAFSDPRCKAWYRPGDPIAGRMDFIVGDGNVACPVDAAFLVMVVNGERFTCRWRQPR